MTDQNGILWAIVRRYGPFGWRPYRIRIKSKPEHAVILGVFLAMSTIHFGFGIKQIQMAWPAILNEKDDRFGLGSKVWSL